MTPALLLLNVFVLGLCFLFWSRWRVARREAYIREQPLPPGLLDKLAARRPQLSEKDRQLVERALRQFFLAYLKAGRSFVSMPSQLADDLWHEFILYTRHYQAFCKEAFGGYLHHTPAVVLGADRRNNVGLRRVWWHACREENIDPRHPSRLPLLFAIDGKMGIADGFRYTADCKSPGDPSQGGSHCGADLGASDSGDGGGDGDGGGCGGGCGGD
ncbi:MAG: hypothetical protein AB1899_00245 [Pseudomonadota bacterium]